MRGQGLPRSLREQVVELPNTDLIQLIDTGLAIILRNAQMILGREDYFYCLLPSAYITAPLLAESGPIPLGVLIRLWE